MYRKNFNPGATNTPKQSFLNLFKDAVKDSPKGLANLKKLRKEKLNILITGPTGGGKTSTINAIFDKPIAKVGVGVDPETMTIEKYEWDNLTIYDSPGLGDGKEADDRHAKGIVDKLQEKDSQGNALIDLVLVVLDGGSRDLGTSYTLINDVIIPALEPTDRNRILVAINQADMAMKGRYWNHSKNEPEQPLIDFLEQKAASVSDRVFSATGVQVRPVYYCAGYKEGDNQEKPWNLIKLLSFMINALPDKKRLILVDKQNQNPNTWERGQRAKEYAEDIHKKVRESAKTVTACTAAGAAVGSFFGPVGTVVGAGIGAAVGIFSSIFG